jgi:hypothetical protein
MPQLYARHTAASQQSLTSFRDSSLAYKSTSIMGTPLPLATMQQQFSNLEIDHATTSQHNGIESAQNQDIDMADQNQAPAAADHPQEHQVQQDNCPLEVQTGPILTEGFYEIDASTTPKKVQYVYIANGITSRYGDWKYTIYGVFISQADAENRIRAETHSNTYKSCYHDIVYCKKIVLPGFERDHRCADADNLAGRDYCCRLGIVKDSREWSEWETEEGYLQLRVRCETSKNRQHQLWVSRVSIRAIGSVEEAEVLDAEKHLAEDWEQDGKCVCSGEKE